MCSQSEMLLSNRGTRLYNECDFVPLHMAASNSFSLVSFFHFPSPPFFFTLAGLQCEICNAKSQH